MAGRVVLVALGALGALIGLGLAAVGTVLLVLTGTDSGLRGESGPLRSESYALVVDSGDLKAAGLADTVRIRVRPAAGPVFVGVGPAAAVRPYLTGTAYDELTGVEITPLRATLLPSGGTGAPERLGDRPGWTVTRTGPGQQAVDVDLTGGEQVLVVTNADGRAGVDVTASVSLLLPFARSLGVGLLVAGVVVALVGGVLLATGVRRTMRARAG